MDIMFIFLGICFFGEGLRLEFFGFMGWKGVGRFRVIVEGRVGLFRGWFSILDLSLRWVIVFLLSF